MATLLTEEAVLTEKDFLRISQVVYDHCGINLHTGKKELVRARLSKLLRSGGFGTFSEYLEHVTQNPDGREFLTFIDVLSTNLTSFFRERQHFDFLENVFLPQMIEKKRDVRNPRIRVWSAGCSSGEEPYSIAMTLLEKLPTVNGNTKILATDISTQVLDTAKAGIYSSERVEQVPPQQKNKYFLRKSENGRKEFEVRPCVKELIIFNYLNLMNDWPVKGPLDFIFCRNVMIYFDKPTQAVLVKRFFDLLDSGGILFTGHSESLTGIEHHFKYVQPTIYMKP